MSILITPTLLNSFDFYLNCHNAQWKKKAFEDILGTLRRDKPWEPTKEIQMGCKFEEAVYDQCAKVQAGAPYKGSLIFQSVVARCVGAEFQCKCRYNETIDGEDYCIYGKMDVFFPKGTPDLEEGYIIDLKTTASFNPKHGPKKYLDGWQNKTYCVATGVSVFEYLIAEWESKEEFKLADLHNVVVRHKDLDAVRQQIKNHIKEFVAWTKLNEETFGTYTALTTIYSR